MNHILRSSFFAVLFLAGLSGAILFIRSAPRSTEHRSISTSIPDATQSGSSKQAQAWSLYENTDHGYTFRYPGTWNLAATNPSKLTLSTNVTDESGRSNRHSMVFETRSNPAHLTLATWVEVNLTLSSPGMQSSVRVLSKEQFDMNGSEAFRVILFAFDSTEEQIVVACNDDSVLLISYSNSLAEPASYWTQLHGTMRAVAATVACD